MRLVQSCLLVVCVLSSRSLVAQAINPDFQKQISASFSSNSFPSSISLSGNASWLPDSLNESGTLSLQASIDGSTNESWSFPTVSHTFAQGPLSYNDFSRSCTYTDAEGSQHTVSGPNCLHSLPWFFPSFVLQPAYSAALTVVDQTGEEDAAQGLEKLTYSVALPASSTSAISSLGRGFTIYYDVKTALPSRLVYQQALDKDDSSGIEIEVQYSNYSLESGYMVPHHIQRSMQRTLTADFTVSTATIQ